MLRRLLNTLHRATEEAQVPEVPDDQTDAEHAEHPEHIEGYSYDRDAWQAAIDAGQPYYWVAVPHHAEPGRYQIRRTEGELGAPLVRDCDLAQAIRVIDALRGVHTRTSRRGQR